MVGLTNPMSKYDRSKMYISVDVYIDMAMKAVIETDKIILDPSKSIKDAVLANILAVDRVENLMLGVGKIQRGKDKNNKPYPYQDAISLAQKAIKEKREPSGLEDILGKELSERQQLANYKLRFLVSALNRSKPITAELKG